MGEIIITKNNNALGRREPAEDMVTAFVTNGVAVSGGVQLGVVYRLKGTADALALKITEAYDTANSILVYHHISEFFRINPNGDLYLLVLAQTYTYPQLLDKGVTPTSKKILLECAGKIKCLMVAYNPVTPIEVGDVTALTAAIAKAQELAVDEYVKHRPLVICLEGKGYDSGEPMDFHALNAGNVFVMCGQDASIANQEISAVFPYLSYGAVGTCAGSVSKSAVNESIAWVEKNNVFGGTLSAPSVGGILISTLTDGDIATMHDSGAIFFRTHAGIAGIYYNSSYTCTALTDDYATIENNRTINKAVRSIRSILLPRLSSPILVDPVSGQLSPAVVKSYENDGNKALEIMLSNDEISGKTVYVDPAQNILSSSELQLEFTLTPVGVANTIRVTIGFNNPA